MGESDFRWPDFEFPELKCDAWRKNKRTGKAELLYTRASQHREYGRTLFKSIVQEWPEDLIEGPNKLTPPDDPEE